VSRRWTFWFVRPWFFSAFAFAEAALTALVSVSLAITRLEDHAWTSLTHHSGLCGAHLS
jgi:hypothetical protein